VPVTLQSTSPVNISGNRDEKVFKTELQAQEVPNAQKKG
jgi:hypothetical protein